jgi:hypothetical protein
MSRTIRLIAVLLFLSSLGLGALSAMPLNHPAVPADGRAGSLMAAVDWVASLFSWDKPHGKVRKPLPTKVAVQVDPDGQH